MSKNPAKSVRRKCVCRKNPDTDCASYSTVKSNLRYHIYLLPLLLSSYIGFCLGVLIKPEILKSGILTSTFNFPNISLRYVFLQDNSFRSEITSAEEIATVAVPGPISRAQTAVNSLIPKNCTLGTESICVGFSDKNSCLALSLSEGLADFPDIGQLKNISLLPESLQDLDRALSTVITQYIEAYFKFGLVSAVFALALGVFLSLSIWVERQQYICHVLGLDIPIVGSLRAFFTVPVKWW